MPAEAFENTYKTRRSVVSETNDTNFVVNEDNERDFGTIPVDLDDSANFKTPPESSGEEEEENFSEDEPEAFSGDGPDTIEITKIEQVWVIEKNYT